MYWEKNGASFWFLSADCRGMRQVWAPPFVFSFFSWRILPPFLFCSLFPVSAAQIQSLWSWNNLTLLAKAHVLPAPSPGMTQQIPFHRLTLSHSKAVSLSLCPGVKYIKRLRHRPNAEYIIPCTHTPVMTFLGIRFKFLISCCILLKTEDVILRLCLPFPSTQRQCCSDFKSLLQWREINGIKGRPMYHYIH